MDRPKWWASVRSGAKFHEANRIAAAEQRRQDRKSRASQSPTAATIPCPHCTKTLSSAEAPMGNFLILLRLGGRAGNDGKREWARASLLSFPFPAFPARCRFFLSPGLRPRNLYGQSSTKEAFLLRTPIHSAAVTDSSISLMRHRPNSFESLIMSRIMSNVPFNLSTLRICIVVNEVFKVRHTELFWVPFN